MTKWLDITTPILLHDHSARHESGGADEISLAGLTVLAQDIDYTLNEYTVATTLSSDNYMVVINASGTTTITLPDAASHTNRKYTIKNIHSTGTVVIDANSTEKIDGEENIELKLQYSYITIVCDGDEWFIIGGEYVKMEDLVTQQLSKQEEIINLLKAIETHLSLGSGEELNKEEE